MGDPATLDRIVDTSRNGGTPVRGTSVWHFAGARYTRAPRGDKPVDSRSATGNNVYRPSLRGHPSLTGGRLKPARRAGFCASGPRVALPGRLPRLLHGLLLRLLAVEAAVLDPL